MDIHTRVRVDSAHAEAIVAQDFDLDFNRLHPDCLQLRRPGYKAWRDLVGCLGSMRQRYLIRVGINPDPRRCKLTEWSRIDLGRVRTDGKFVSIDQFKEVSRIQGPQEPGLFPPEELGRFVEQRSQFDIRSLIEFFQSIRKEFELLSEFR
jgi:hypothetical protein